MIVLAAGLALTAVGFGMVWLGWAKPLSEAPVDNDLLSEAAPYFHENDQSARKNEAPEER